MQTIPRRPLKRPPRTRAFTLIELLVVVAIVSLLSSIILTNVNYARAKAQNTVRVNEVKEIIAAEELMYTTEGHYLCSGWQDSTNPQFLAYLVSAGYLPAIPRDPINNPNSGLFPYTYISASAYPGGPCGQYFQLEYDSATEHDVDTQCGLAGGDGRWQTPTHCHFDYPSAFPCSDPYLHNYPYVPDCNAILN